MEEAKFPYVNAYGKIPEVFEKLSDAPEPPKLTHEMLQKILGRVSNSDRPFISFLKRLRFLDDDNVPTQYYKDYRESNKSKAVMAKCMRDVYSEVFATHEKLHNLEKNEILDKFKIVTGLGKDSKVLTAIVACFQELANMADFNAEITDEKPYEKVEEQTVENEEELSGMLKKLGFSYTINLNLPATTDPRVYNAIFKSLKENIFK